MNDNVSTVSYFKCSEYPECACFHVSQQTATVSVVLSECHGIVLQMASRVFQIKIICRDYKIPDFLNLLEKKKEGRKRVKIKEKRQNIAPPRYSSYCITSYILQIVVFISVKLKATQKSLKLLPCHF